MILQSLYELHDRLAADPENYGIAPDGYSVVAISFVVCLEPNGKLVDIQDYRDHTGKPRGRNRLVPGSKNHTNKIAPFLLRDTARYIFGYCEDEEQSKIETALACFEAFRKYHISLQSKIQNDDFSAVCHFLSNWTPEKLECDPKILLNSGVFQIRGKKSFVHEHPDVTKYVESIDEGGDHFEKRSCLVTGREKPIALKHEPPIGGNIYGAQASASLVSFNQRSFESYGNSEMQGINAPVSKDVSIKYCKTLNALLLSDRHQLRIGDATTVFWTGQPTKIESVLKAWLEDEADEGASSQDKGLRELLETSLRSVINGQPVTTSLSDDASTPFYLLGLTGQAGGRIGVRFWHECSLGDFVEKLAMHYSALKIARQWGAESKRPDPEFPKVWQLLRQTGRESKDIPPNLSGALMRAILNGTPYPQMLAANVINRIRADREINYLRASILKAWLTRLPNSNLYNISMTYDVTNPDVAYRLGALFAVLEKTQQDALGDINAGIRDRFYSSASATPASVFPRLMRTYQHHLSKASSQNKGYQIYREREIQSILAEPTPFSDFPNHLNLKQQGLFAIGFYHKRTDLWKKKDKTEDTQS